MRWPKGEMAIELGPFIIDGGPRDTALVTLLLTGSCELLRLALVSCDWTLWVETEPLMLFMELWILQELQLALVSFDWLTLYWLALVSCCDWPLWVVTVVSCNGTFIISSVMHISRVAIGFCELWLANSLLTGFCELLLLALVSCGCCELEGNPCYFWSYEYFKGCNWL